MAVTKRCMPPEIHEVTDIVLFQTYRLKAVLHTVICRAVICC